MKLLSCSACKETLPSSDFYKNRKNKKRGHHYYCKECFKKHDENYKKRKLELQMKRESTIEGHCKRSIHSIKKRIKPKPIGLDREFLISLWNKQEGLCAVTGKLMDLKKGEGLKSNSPSLDRINNNKEYLKDNVRWVCHKVNSMKGTFTDKELKEWCVSIVQGMKE